MSTSGKFAAAPSTRTSTWPGPGSGSGTSASASTSRGSPSSRTCHALIAYPLPLQHVVDLGPQLRVALRPVASTTHVIIAIDLAP